MFSQTIAFESGSSASTDAASSRSTQRSHNLRSVSDQDLLAESPNLSDRDYWARPWHLIPISHSLLCARPLCRRSTAIVARIDRCRPCTSPSLRKVPFSCGTQLKMAYPDINWRAKAVDFRCRKCWQTQDTLSRASLSTASGSSSAWSNPR